VLWARERIGALMDQLRGGVPEAEIRDAVLKLALEASAGVALTPAWWRSDRTPARSAEASAQVRVAAATICRKGGCTSGVFGELPRGATGMRFDLLAGALLLLLAALLWHRARV
jgi:hypothetical protein